MNQLHVVALNEGLRRKKALWRPAGRAELQALSLAPWASRRRQDLLDLLDRLTPKIHELNGKAGAGRSRASGDAAAEYASWSRPADRAGLRVGDWDAGTFCLRQADRQLRGAGSHRRVEARKLAVELYWMWRRGWDYQPMQRLGSHAGEPGNPHGVQ